MAIKTTAKFYTGLPFFRNCLYVNHVVNNIATFVVKWLQPVTRYTAI